MPSPLAHLAAGTLLARQARCSTTPTATPTSRRLLAATLLFSIAPDLDILPGLLIGTPTAFHNQATHSLLFGLAVCTATALALWRHFPNCTRGRILLLFNGSYGLHLLMDGLTVGRGLPWLWPFSDTRWAAPYPLFYGLRHSEGLLSPYHLVTLVSEVATLGVILLIAQAWRRHFQTTR